jgi:hypothetical protein
MTMPSSSTPPGPIRNRFPVGMNSQKKASSARKLHWKARDRFVPADEPSERFALWFILESMPGRDHEASADINLVNSQFRRKRP